METTWGLQALNLDSLWRQGLDGEGIRIGHLDTGLQAEHPALAGRLAAYLRVDEQGSLDYQAAPSDEDGHGSHIAGILCGGVVDGIRIGVAPKAMLYSAQVIDGGKDILRILRGLIWLLEQRPHLLCLPLGLREANPIFQPVLARLRQQGCLVIAPAGNQPRYGVQTPASDPHVLAVGALDDELELASYSARDRRTEGCLKPEMLAPGSQIPSIDIDSGGLASMSGTSQACAHVVGVAALLRQAVPTARAEQIAASLLQSAQQSQPICSRYGLIDPLAALQRLQHDSISNSSDDNNEEVFFYRDPSLLHQCRQAAAHQQIECLVIAPTTQRVSLPQLLKQIFIASDEQPHHLQHLPPAEATWLTVSPHLLRSLLQHPDLSVVSSVAQASFDGLA